MNTSEMVSPAVINSPPVEIKSNVQGELMNDSLQNLSNRLDKIEESLNGISSILTQVPGMLAMVTDTADEVYQQTERNGVNLDDRLKITLQLVERITQPASLEKLDALLTLSNQLPGLMAMGVDVLDEQMKGIAGSEVDLNALADIASISSNSLSQAKSETPMKIGGLFGIFKVLRNADIQRGLGFFLNFFKHFGRNLKS